MPSPISAPEGPTPDPLPIAVLTVSDTRTEETDKSGGLLCDFVREAGHRLVAKTIVPDDLLTVRSVVQQWLAAREARVVLVTGGTGLTRRDVTPEALLPLFDKEIPGFGELFRLLSYEEIGASTIQSRCVAGLAGQALVFALPGSTGACRLAVDRILRAQLDSRTKPCNFAELLPRM